MGSFGFPFVFPAPEPGVSLYPAARSKSSGGFLTTQKENKNMIHTLDDKRKTLAARLLANVLGCRSVTDLLEANIACVIAAQPDKARHWKAVGPGHKSSTDAKKIAYWIQTGVCTVINVMDGRSCSPHMDDVYAGYESFVLEALDDGSFQDLVKSGMGTKEALQALSAVLGCATIK